MFKGIKACLDLPGEDVSTSTAVQAILIELLPLYSFLPTSKSTSFFIKTGCFEPFLSQYIPLAGM